jgi:predicted nucleic acid-binding protein
METLVGAPDARREAQFRRFLSRFEVVQLTPAIAARAVVVRRTTRLKLPDAIVMATAIELGCELVTRNTRDFSHSDPLVRIPYRL